MGEILKKLTVRNLIAVGTVSAFLAVVYRLLTGGVEVTDSPVLMMLLGQFSTVVGLIYYFYFRKPQSKESTVQ
jgi:hypothetical protein